MTTSSSSATPPGRRAVRSGATASGRTPANASGRPVTAYAYLQAVVGVIALLLAPVVALGDWAIDHHRLRGSISSYYYGRTGGYFVGSLCALGVFFLSYQYRPGPDHTNDRRLSLAAFVTAIAVALFPTSSDGRQAHAGSKAISMVHALSATILFTLLAVFSLVEFTKTQGEAAGTTTTKAKLARAVRTQAQYRNTMTTTKRTRNRIYRTSGWVIIGCMAGIGFSNLAHWNTEFWLESLAVVAFGFAWLVKSEWIPGLRG